MDLNRGAQNVSIYSLEDLSCEGGSSQSVVKYLEN